MAKHLLGWIFILVAIILTLAILGQLASLFSAIFQFFAIFTGEIDSYQIGRAIGGLIYWVFHFAATIALWRFGLRFIKKISN
jgi:hypothetical protein